MANEKRLIDADLTDVEVLQREKECVKRKTAANCTDCLNCDLLMTDERILSAYDNAIKALQTTVDAVEVVHGGWNTEKCDHVPWRIKNPEKWVIYKCSVCGYSNGRKQSNYCPNCGAKMDGGNEDG